MKAILFSILYLFFLNFIIAQEAEHPELLKWQNDSLSSFERVVGYTNYTWETFVFSDPDSAYQLLSGAMEFAQEHNDLRSQGYINNQMGVTHGIRGNLNEARMHFSEGAKLVLEAGDHPMYINIIENLAHSYEQGGMLSKALEIIQHVEAFGDSVGVKYDKNYINEMYGSIYLSQNKLAQAKQKYFEAVDLYTDDTIGVGTNLKYLGDVYQKENQLDSALYYYQKSLDIFRHFSKSNACQTALSLGKLYLKIGDLQEAEAYLDQTLATALELSLNDEITGAYIAFGQIEKQKENTNRAIANYEKALQYARAGAHLINQETCTAELYQLYKKLNQSEFALDFLEQNKIINDSIKSDDVKKQLQLLDFRNQVFQDSLRRENIIETNQLRFEASLRSRNFIVFILVGVVLTMIFFAFFQYRSKRVKEALLKEVQQKNKEVTQMNAEIIKAQDQLVVQEKLASLGQLTAGIAHEIKNPLNFITNFAEDSIELLEEVNENLGEGQAPLSEHKKEIVLKDIKDIKLNLVDIQNSGKRVDQIINNMMNHTRESEGKQSKENINELVRINANFAYQGYRATHRSFFAKINYEFDNDLPEIYVYTQELGRVILNLINNACYAINQKKAIEQEDYQPGIFIRTRQLGERLFIEIRDNGTGIPEQVKHKIFNPFFTTKPTGSGNTGLGLSISYEIISTLHDGKINVESEEGVYTEFIIELPLRLDT